MESCLAFKCMLHYMGCLNTQPRLVIVEIGNMTYCTMYLGSFTLSFIGKTYLKGCILGGRVKAKRLSFSTFPLFLITAQIILR